MNIYTPPTNFSKVSRILLSLLTVLILQSGFALAQDAPFITVWKTDNEGSSEDNQITIPGTGTDYFIEWEEVGNEANNSGSETGTDEHTITFPTAGTYRVKISGDFTRIAFSNEGDREKIFNIEQWGDIVWSSFNSAFSRCSNLNQSATDVPDLSNVTDMRRMFYKAWGSFKGDLSNWDVSNVTDMSEMFVNSANFDGDISSWDVSNVTDMSGMFQQAFSFKGDLSNWDVSNVTDMSSMFLNHINFNGDISNWDVSNVTDMRRMFYKTGGSFKGDLSNWDVSNVTDMSGMFQDATSFNADISNWDVSIVTDMSGMFQGAISFNADISNWDVSNVTNMSEMFLNTDEFNQNLGEWNISKVKNMTDIIRSSGINPINYDSTLIGWVSQEVIPRNINLGSVSGLIFCSASEARQKLVNDFGWTMSGDVYCFQDYFVSRWNTENEGESNASQIIIPGTGTDYLIEWEQVDDLENTGNELGNDMHTLTLPNPGEYRIKISGDFRAVRFANSGDKNKLLSVNSWGIVEWETMDSAFFGCKNLLIKAGNAPDLSLVSDMSYAFKDTNIKGIELKNWNTQSVNNMAGMFSDAVQFNVALSDWDVSSVTSFENMFSGAANFNQNLAAWDISSAVNLLGMLDNAGLSTTNYEATLKSWSSHANIPSNMNFGASGLNYCYEAGRNFLIESKNWTFSGDSKNCSNLFVTVWKTDNEGSSEDNQIIIPGTGTNYFIEWEEVGNEAGNNGSETGTDEHTITFPNAGTYRVKISGDFTRINFYYHGDGRKIMDIEQWGEIGWSSFNSAFFGCSNLNQSAIDTPDLSDVTDMRNMFRLASSFNGDISNWDVSNVTNMQSMFNRASSFNADISNWDVSKVIYMDAMFLGARSFNADLNNWDVSSVVGMSFMFEQTLPFNKDLNNWNVSNVTDMRGMFSIAGSFNGDISNWDVSKVTDMSNLFFGNDSFNGDISNWDVSNVTDMSGMFLSADAFNGDLNNWDVSNVTDMSGMFVRASVFNGDISNWDVSNVTDMSGMFEDATVFNIDLKNWNVSNATNMGNMFAGADAFAADISNWDVSNVTNMRGMFHNAGSFNQDLGNWNIVQVDNMEDMLSNSGLNTYYYGQTLLGWANLENIPSNLTLGAAAMKYCLSEQAREFLINDKNWTINGDVQDCNSDLFITVWQTDNAGATEDNQISIPGTGADYTILWEEVNNVENNGQEAGIAYPTLTFPHAGTYRVKIYGDFNAINFSLSEDQLKIIDIENWGDMAWNTMNSAFARTKNMSVTATDRPNLSQVTDLSSMFYEAESFNQDISNWRVGHITDMSDLFHGATSFNQDLSNWDVSNVTKMTRMFARTDSFNRDLNTWNTKNVEEMDFMFWDADAFQGNISEWNTSNVNTMWGMFYSADSFNMDLSAWDVDSVTNMQEMFREAGSFNQDISNWNVSNVTGMYGMFYEASSFDQNLGSWNLSNCGSMFEFLSYSGLSLSNYDLSLEGWATSGNIPSDIALSAEGLYYCASAEYRQQLIDQYAWGIIGDETCSLVMQETMPAVEATSVEKDIEIYLTFDQEIVEIDFSGITLTDVSGRGVFLTDIYIDSLTLHLVHNGLGSNTYEVMVPDSSFISASGKENDTISWSFTTQRVLSSNQEQKLIAHAAFPNPFSDFTTIQFNLPQTQSVNLLVFDLKGQIVRQETYDNLPSDEQSIRFERKDLPAGLYHYQLQSASGTVGGKMLIE